MERDQDVVGDEQIQLLGSMTDSTLTVDTSSLGVVRKRSEDLIGGNSLCGLWLTFGLSDINFWEERDPI